MPKIPSLRSLTTPILVPAGLYLGLFLARPLWFTPWCARDPSPCTMDQVNVLDRITFQYQSVLADFLSNLLQNSVGVAAFALPWLLLRKSPWVPFRLNLGLLSATAWNGVLVEMVRALVQRPRPLVFRSPMGDGSNIHQYTSFYSGHTSFVALALFMTFLGIQDYAPESKKRTLRWTALIAYIGLTLLTAALRVVGGRHYPSDTLGGFVLGSLVGGIVYLFLVRRVKYFDTNPSQ